MSEAQAYLIRMKMAGSLRPFPFLTRIALFMTLIRHCSVIPSDATS